MLFENIALAIYLSVETFMLHYVVQYISSQCFTKKIEYLFSVNYPIVIFN